MERAVGGLSRGIEGLHPYALVIGEWSPRVCAWAAPERHRDLPGRFGGDAGPADGGDKGAIAGTLSIMVGGASEDFDRAMPLFAAMGKTIVHVGGAGAGQIVKACNQMVVAINYAAVSEALVAGAKAGVDPAKIVQVLSGGLAASRVLELKGPSMIEHQFQPGFRTDLHRKDLAIALATARETSTAVPVTAVVTQLFEALAAAGRGDLDHSALVTIYEELARFMLGGTA